MLPGLCLLVAPALASPVLPAAGPWRAVLHSESGPIPVEMEISPADSTLVLVNGDDVRILAYRLDGGGTLRVAFDYYDARVTARLDKSGRSMHGLWTRRIAPDYWARLEFTAEAGSTARFAAVPPPRPPVAQQRWSLRLDDLDGPSLLLLDVTPDGAATGSILNPVGDYRTLAGHLEEQRLRLSRFDGAHAFLLDLELRPDSLVQGVFQEGNYRRVGVSGRIDPEAAVPPPFGQFEVDGPIRLDQEQFFDLEGRPASISGAQEGARGYLVELLGTWCPNCHEASAFLQELHESYAERGLGIVGLAFEISRDAVHNRRQLRRYARELGLAYPILLAYEGEGRSPGEIFPGVRGTFGYPTVLFVRPDGTVTTVHTGFTGRATGEAFPRLKASFHEKVEELLAAGG